MYDIQADPAPPAAAPGTATYLKRFLHCAACNRLDLDKPEYHPQGDAGHCLGCRRQGGLKGIDLEIRFVTFRLCPKCHPLPLRTLFLPAARTPRGEIPCPGCSGVLAAADKTRDYPVIYRHTSHDTSAYQVVPTKDGIQPLVDLRKAVDAFLAQRTESRP